MVTVAVEGCCHGELDAIYNTIVRLATEKNVTCDLLLVCGDFECIRDIYDLKSVAVPQKYRKLVSIVCL
jgi:lariat debranching enzyme